MTSRIRSLYRKSILRHLGARRCVTEKPGKAAFREKNARVSHTAGRRFAVVLNKVAEFTAYFPRYKEEERRDAGGRLPPMLRLLSHPRPAVVAEPLEPLIIYCSTSQLDERVDPEPMRPFAPAEDIYRDL